MDLLNAIEELEQPTHTCSSTKTIEHKHDFIERQVLCVQEKLRELWLRKRGGRVQIAPCIPFYWVFSNVVRLIEEYPDGLTQAVVLTEMSTLLEHKVARDTDQEASVLRKKRKFRDTKDLEDFFAENEQEAMQANVLSYGNHRLTLEMTDGYDAVIHMYLHQRFRFCIDFLHDKLQNEPSCVPTFPFQAGRKVAFTNVKALERKDVDGRAMEQESDQAELALLPTSFLSVRLEDRFVLDRKLLADAISLAQVDQLVNGVQDETAIQQLMVKVRVLDIGAIRPCQTPLYVQRQVILLGEVEETDCRLLGGSTPNTQRLAQGLHLMVLWDEQVVLSRLFRVNDILAIVHPFVHLCVQRHAEIVHILNEYLSQQQLTYFFEYGSATTLFCKPCQVATLKKAPATAIQLHGQGEVERPLLNLDDVKPGWYNFSLYAHVRSINVSHGIPLLAAFFHAYYDDKTNRSTAGNANVQSPLPFDRTIMSKYHLVVLLQVCVASSERQLTIEVTGENALVALRLHPGHSVFIDGLVTMDLRSHKVRRFRNAEAMALASTASKAQAAFAFSTTAYNMPPSGVIALCSDWKIIFGNQSLFSNNCKLKVLNTTLGLMNTTLDRSSLASPFDVMTRHALAMVVMTVVGAGWLIPSDNNRETEQLFTIDSTCELEHSTTCAHKNCFRPVEMMTRTQHPATSPLKWQCQFCHELLSGPQDTVPMFCEMAVILEIGQSSTSPTVVLCQGPTVEILLGISAEDYRQLPLAQQHKRVEHVLHTSLRLMISRCEPRRVSVSSSSSTRFQHQVQLDSTMTATATTPRTFERTINFRMDMVQPIDTLAATHDYLTPLHETM
uniref:Uncharacterized protein n=1 Tax=Peronospora matthiolae TaxID=2874970 RepID=A0AAV1TIG2_9STRA